MILNSSQVRHLLQQAGFTEPDLTLAVAIANCESGFDTNANKITSAEDSRGLMQINVRAHPFYAQYNLYDPVFNTQVAFEIYRNAGRNFTPWRNCMNIVLGKKKEIPVDDKIIFGTAIALLLILCYT